METLTTSQTYVLRCWTETGEAEEGAQWRFVLENVTTGEREGYPTLDALMAALKGKFGERSPPDATEASSITWP